MCLLFYQLNEDAAPGSFHLVLACVRDEYWDRPTLPSGFWADNPSCIGGIDLQTGSGGTWLAMNREGKLAVLLNILMNEEDNTKMSRGALVSDYVKNKESNIERYLNDIAKNAEHFKDFNLVLFDLKLKSTYYYTNETKDSKPVKLQSGTYAFGNTEMTKPWKKVIAGKESFKDVLAQFSEVKDQEKLQTALFDLMSTEERYFDEEAAVEFPGKDYITAYITCRNTNTRYGSRTHTVILVDGEGNCTFLEKTLQTPVVVDNYNWESSSHSFRLNLD